MTGADGFAGRWLCRHLEACGDDVDIATEASGFELRDSHRVRSAVIEAQPDVIFHLAGQHLVGESWKDPAATFEVNAAGTLHLLDAALACDTPPRVLLMSTADVYGHVAPEDLPIAEGHPMAPVSPFAVSKVAAEYLGIQAHLGTRLPVVRARIFSNIGPEQPSHFLAPTLAGRIIAAARTDATHLVVGNLDIRRDYVDIRDAVRALRLLAERGESGGVYNVCSGRDVSVRKIAEHLLDAANVDFDLVVDPALVRPREISLVRGDPSLIEKATGWRPEIKLEQTLRDVFRHCGEREQRR